MTRGIDPLTQCSLEFLHVCLSLPKLAPEPAIAGFLLDSELCFDRALQTLKHLLSPFFWPARGCKTRIGFSSTGLLIDRGLSLNNSQSAVTSFSESLSLYLNSTSICFQERSLTKIASRDSLSLSLFGANINSMTL